MSDKNYIRYSTVATALHWLIAAALAFQMGLGGALEDLTPETGLFAAAQLHKSIGITILLLSLLRLGWRWFKPPPPALPDSRQNHLLSKTVHTGLYAFMIGAPLSGWLLVSTSKLGIDTYIFSTLYWPHIPFVGGLETSAKAALNDVAAAAHNYLGWLGLALFLLHVAGALRHQLLKGEPLLARIWPGRWAAGKMTGTMLMMAAFAVMFSLSSIAQQLYGSAPEEPVASVPDAPPANADQLAQAADIDSGGPISEDEQANQTKHADRVETDNEDQPDNADDSDQNAEADNKDIKPDPAIAHDWQIIERAPIAFSFAWNGETVRGRFADWQADIRFGADALAQSRIDVRVNLASGVTGNPQIDDALPGADFFAAALNPQARFMSSDIRSTGGDNYEARGTLTLKGISQPTVLRFSLALSGNQAVAKGNASIDRNAHKVGEGSYGDISDKVAVSFQLTAEH